MIAEEAQEETKFSDFGNDDGCQDDDTLFESQEGDSEFFMFQEMDSFIKVRAFLLT